MRRMIGLMLLTFLGLVSSLTFAQEELTISLEWKDNPGKMQLPTSILTYPNLKNAYVSETEFWLVKEFKRFNDGVYWDFDFVSYQLGDIDETAKEFLENNLFSIPEEPLFNVNNNRKNGIPVAMLTLFPFVKIDGKIQRIEEITLRKKTKANNQLKSHQFADNSVLREGSGEWYEITVKKDGIYKIDYGFLKSMGINVDNLHPDDINIFGNGYGKLPKDNHIERPDDLIKNAIYIHGDGDGSFDKGDYILFYGKGPDRWDWDAFNEVFKQVRNVYARETKYFININSLDAPKRIENAPLVNDTESHFVTDYNSYGIHEKEEVNLMKSGQRWYGEKFDSHLTQSFSMNIPNLNPNEPAVLEAYFGFLKRTKAGSITMNVSHNNHTLGEYFIAALNSSGDSYIRGGIKTKPGEFQPSGSTFSIKTTMDRGSPAYIGYLDYIAVNARSFLTYKNQRQFRDVNSMGPGNIAKMSIEGAPSNCSVWDISNPTQPKVMPGNLDGGNYTFKFHNDTVKEFVMFQNSGFEIPSYNRQISYQNLHGLEPADYLIVTHKKFLSQAERLANLHRDNGLTVHVVTTQQVFNEFSGGTQDPTAIKFFAKMFYDRYGNDPVKKSKYLLLFGTGSYDPLNREEHNTNYVPVFETENSEAYTSSLMSDDYYGFLDDSEGFGVTDNLDIAIGRLVASTEQHAKDLVDKIELYMHNGSDSYDTDNLACGEDGYISTHGDWRLRQMTIADDEENGWFIYKDLEPVSDSLDNNHPEINTKKVYIDAYKQVTTAGGERYPEVNEEIKRNLQAGSLVTTYVGHGGPNGAAQERIITIGDMESLTNLDKLTLFVSATCEWARVDDYNFESIGERMALDNKGGAIALMTTPRALLFTVNDSITKHFYENVFKRDAQNRPRTFGEIIMGAKNDDGNAVMNRRSFLLMGDPALRIALPYEKIVLDSINNVSLTQGTDTIRALSKVKMTGHVEDQFGNHLTNFNGKIQPSIFDKKVEKKTLGQDDDSPVIPFYTQDNVLFKGKSTVKDGKFSFEFIVPKDIDYSYGKGKASFYGWTDDEKNNAGGYENEFFIGGIDTTGLDDQEGPEIELYLNDEDFVNGGMTDETPTLIVKLYDESGINTAGTGIGHDITMILDEETSESKVLNEYYEADLDTYKSGEIRYPLNELEPGEHTLTVKAWDVNNNSNEHKIEFVVHKKEDIALEHVLNYPNPFTTYTEFFFEHNQVCATLEAQVQIYTVTGRLVRTINQIVETRGFRAEGIPWDGKDEFGDQLARGVYVYRISITNPEGEKAQEMQKIYLLK